MKTYVIDWGKGCTGGRYGLIQAKSYEDAFWCADEIGSPFQMGELVAGCPWK